MQTVWIACQGDQSNPRAIFATKAEADFYAGSVVGTVVFEGRITIPFYFINLGSSSFPV